MAKQQQDCFNIASPAYFKTVIFTEKLQRSALDNNSLVCVGLDADIGRLPKQFAKSRSPLFDFNRAIIDATADLVCAFKPNTAFYEAEGAAGITQLQKTCRYIQQKYPNVPIIIDAKRGDIGNTNAAYARFVFDYLGGDAVTLQPYMGNEAIEPFLNYNDKGLFILCRTSNKGAGEFQDLTLEDKHLYEIVAENVAGHWNKYVNCHLVVGATGPEELARVREIVGQKMQILVPGVGTQGGDLLATLKAGLTARENGLIINSSRGIIYASSGDDFAEAARAETMALREIINKFRWGKDKERF